jgi:hypothetical protein
MVSIEYFRSFVEIYQPCLKLSCRCSRYSLKGLSLLVPSVSGHDHSVHILDFPHEVPESGCTSVGRYHHAPHSKSSGSVNAEAHRRQEPRGGSQEYLRSGRASLLMGQGAKDRVSGTAARNCMSNLPGYVLTTNLKQPVMGQLPKLDQNAA